MIIDIIFSIIFIGVDIFLWKYAQYLKQGIADNKDDDDPEVQKQVKIAKALTIIIPVVMVVVAIPVITWGIIPLLTLLFGGLIASVTKFLREYGGYIVIVSLIVYYLNNRKPKTDENNNDDNNPVEVEYNEQEAEALHDDIAELTYNAIINTDAVDFKKPRNVDSIEAGTETPFVMDGIMAKHRFWADLNLTSVNVKFNEDFAVQQLQRHMNQQAKRYPQLYRDGRPPIIFDIKNNGDFVVIEVVLYSEKYKSKIEARRKARIARQQMMGDSYDRDF